MTFTIENVILNSEMIRQIKDWQQNQDLEADLMTIDRAIDCILEQSDVDEIECPRSTEYLQLIKLLRYLSKSLLKFKCTEMEDNDE